MFYLHPTNDELLIDLYRVQIKIFDMTDIIAKNKIRERILLDELQKRAVDIATEQPKALDRFYDEC